MGTLSIKGGMLKFQNENSHWTDAKLSLNITLRIHNCSCCGLSHSLMPERQSAYRQHHSTETAVTRVYNDLLLAADEGDVSARCLLDLTAAFDTVCVDWSVNSVYEVSSFIGSHVPVRQIVSGRIRKLHVVSGYHQLLSAPRFCNWVRDYSFYTWHISQTWLWFCSHADNSQLHLQCYRQDMMTKWSVYYGCEPLDGGEQTQAKRRQDWAALDWFQLQFCFTW